MAVQGTRRHLVAGDDAAQLIDRLVNFPIPHDFDTSATAASGEARAGARKRRTAEGIS
jgi:hypothetical protein